MNIFQQITEFVKRQYSTFDMKNNWVGSVNDFGSLNCIYHSIVLPSDTWKLGHNVMVKLPPLISPAFTRIKGIVNSYYCSYASVWNYWNSFISDKPEDVFLSRSLTASYKGKFVEPCCGMTVIAFICKVAYGYFDFFSSGTDKFSVTYATGTPATITVNFRPLFNRVPSSFAQPTNIVWSYDSNGRRFANLSSNITSADGISDEFWHDAAAYSLTFPDFSSSAVGTPHELGFSNLNSYFIWCCQQVERNLSNHGVPTDLIARTNINFYKDDFFNLLNFIAESSIWQYFYRDEQNQSPEPDYREVNGCISDPSQFYGSSSSMPYGWRIRLLGMPMNVSTGSDFWMSLTSNSQVFAFLTGFQLEHVVRDHITSRSSATDVIILPKFYNGLLILKYRNFEKDYFTSACVDPNFGGVNVQVPSTIDALRTASKLEEFLEVSASARDFYNFMKHIFGTNPESTRYQKPLLLGTQVVPIQIGEQLQTSETTSNSPLGDRGGIADGYGNSGTINHYFNEHGLVISYLSFVLDSQYMQGMPFEFNHHLQLDYPFPQFANLGAESIPTKEIYYSSQQMSRSVDYETGDNNAVVNNSTYVQNLVDDSLSPSPSGVLVGNNVDYVVNVIPPFTDAYVYNNPVRDHSTQQSIFGYTPRYSRWKFKQDVVAGQMRSSLEFWHTFRHFSTVPYISNAFVSYMNAGYLSNLNRIFAVDDDSADKFVCDIFNNGSVRRCLPLVPQTTMD